MFFLVSRGYTLFFSGNSQNFMDFLVIAGGHYFEVFFLVVESVSVDMMDFEVFRAVRKQAVHVAVASFSFSAIYLQRIPSANPFFCPPILSV